MSAQQTFGLGDVVEIVCFTYSNPASINGPFGDIELMLLPLGEVVGSMTLNLLVGIPSSGKLLLNGTCEGDQIHTLELNGKGYMTEFGQKPQFIESAITLNMDSDWQKGTLVFSAEMPEVAEGLPVTRKVCHS